MQINNTHDIRWHRTIAKCWKNIDAWELFLIMLLCDTNHSNVFVRQDLPSHVPRALFPSSHTSPFSFDKFPLNYFSQLIIANNNLSRGEDGKKVKPRDDKALWSLWWDYKRNGFSRFSRRPKNCERFLFNRFLAFSGLFELNARAAFLIINFTGRSFVNYVKWMLGLSTKAEVALDPIPVAFQALK